MSSKKAVGNDWLILEASLADVFLPLSAHFTIDFHMVFLYIHIHFFFSKCPKPFLNRKIHCTCLQCIIQIAIQILSPCLVTFKKKKGGGGGGGGWVLFGFCF